MHKAEDVISSTDLLIVDIIAIHKTHDIFMNRFIKKSDIKPSQYYMLNYLYGNEELNQSDIAACCFMDRCGVSRAFKEFEEKGLIIREVVEDNKREYNISLTEKGIKLAEFFKNKEKEWENEVCKDLNINLDKLKSTLNDLSYNSIDFNKKFKK